jgi:tRNA pseudouridine38/39 synthase
VRFTIVAGLTIWAGRDQVVDELLDVGKVEGRPHYQMASEIPLVFWEAAYDEIEWTYDPGLSAILGSLRARTRD